MLLVVPSVLLFIHMILYSIWYRCSEDKVTHTLMYHLSKIFCSVWVCFFFCCYILLVEKFIHLIIIIIIIIIWKKLTKVLKFQSNKRNYWKKYISDNFLPNKKTIQVLTITRADKKDYDDNFFIS